MSLAQQLDYDLLHTIATSSACYLYALGSGQIVKNNTTVTCVIFDSWCSSTSNLEVTWKNPGSNLELTCSTGGGAVQGGLAPQPTCRLSIEIRTVQ